MAVLVTMAAAGPISYGSAAANRPPATDPWNGPAAPPTPTAVFPESQRSATPEPGLSGKTQEEMITLGASAGAGFGGGSTRAGSGPAPYVPGFGSREEPLPALPSPTAPATVPANVDGCDHAYGGPGYCVPWTFPVGVEDRCAWLAGHGYPPLAVLGPDRHGLDADGDGTACGPGD